eukprot:176449_1
MLVKNKLDITIHIQVFISQHHCDQCHDQETISTDCSDCKNCMYNHRNYQVALYTWTKFNCKLCMLNFNGIYKKWFNTKNPIFISKIFTTKIMFQICGFEKILNVAL